MIWTPSREFVESTNVWRFLRWLGFSGREDFLQFSAEHPERFWPEILREMNVEFFEPYTQVMDAGRGPEWTRWFLGGRLNIAHNCLDRWADSDRVACIWESESGETRTVTFAALRAESNRVANGLAALGLEPGDRVALCLPMIPEILALLYGCFKAGLTVVPIFAEAVRSAVSLSHRYLPERRLPDKAIGVLDTAAARAALAQQGTPPGVEDIDRSIRIAQAELDVRKKEGDGKMRGPTIEELEAELTKLNAERTQTHERWTKERDLVAQIHKIERNGKEEPQLAELHKQLGELQQTDALVPLAVDSRLVASVISGWTGIPVGRMLADEVRSVLTLKERLAERIVGQSQALDAICRRVSTSRAGLEDPSKPKGVFLLVGPTGDRKSTRLN